MGRRKPVDGQGALALGEPLAAAPAPVATPSWHADPASRLAADFEAIVRSKTISALTDLWRSIQTRLGSAEALERAGVGTAIRRRALVVLTKPTKDGSRTDHSTAIGVIDRLIGVGELPPRPYRAGESIGALPTRARPDDEVAPEDGSSRAKRTAKRGAR